MTTRDDTIRGIRVALRQHTGQPWSVTGGRGTSWGWITVTAPPRRQVHGEMTPADRATLTQALGLEQLVHSQGEMIPADSGYWREYLERASGRQPASCGRPYWD